MLRSIKRDQYANSLGINSSASKLFRFGTISDIENVIVFKLYDPNLCYKDRLTTKGALSKIKWIPNSTIQRDYLSELLITNIRLVPV